MFPSMNSIVESVYHFIQLKYRAETLLLFEERVMGGLFFDSDFDFGRLAAALGGDGGRAELALGGETVVIDVYNLKEKQNNLRLFPWAHNR